MDRYDPNGKYAIRVRDSRGVFRTIETFSGLPKAGMQSKLRAARLAKHVGVHLLRLDVPAPAPTP